MAASLRTQLPARVGDDRIALAVRKALVRDGLPDIGNPFLYAKETALRLAGEDREQGLEARERVERAADRGLRTEGWQRPAPVIPAPAESGNRDQERDEFVADMERALAQRPVYQLVRIAGNPPVLESAKDRILGAVALLYRSRGQSPDQFLKVEVPDPDNPRKQKTVAYAICIRRADAVWTQSRLWDWYRIVEQHVQAQRAGAAYVPEIPNAYSFLLESLMKHRKETGAEEADPALVQGFAV